MKLFVRAIYREIIHEKIYINTKRHHLHLKESIIIIVLVSFSLALFTTLSLYMSVYSSRVSDVQGRMPLTFDYEFLTEQYICFLIIIIKALRV